MRLLVATGNEGKVREMRRLLAENAATQEWEVISLSDLALLWQKEELGGLPRISGTGRQKETAIHERYNSLALSMEETGTTFEENAAIKALGAASFTGFPALADDSGLEVDWLEGAPGVYSARYTGPNGDEKTCNDLLLANMANAPDGKRTARYVAVLVLAAPEGTVYQTRGVCEGHIGFFPRGEGGFGYDPLFFPSGCDRTIAELTLDEKNKMSHRSKALTQMVPFFSKLVLEQP